MSNRGECWMCGTPIDDDDIIGWRTDTCRTCRDQMADEDRDGE